MQKIGERVWKNYMNVKGGDFINWSEGLSPIEKKAWEMKFSEVQCS